MVPDELPRDLPSFLARFGTDAQCRAYLFAQRWPQGFCCPGCGHGRGLPPSAAADRRVRRLRQAAFAAGRDDVRADQDRPGALVSGDLAGDLEQGRHLGHGAAAADGLRQLPDRLVLAAQDPQGHGPARSAGRWPHGSRPTRRWSAVPGRAGPAAVPPARPWSPVRSRRHPARAAGVGSAGCGCRPCADASAESLEALPRRQRRPARRGHHRRLAGLCRAGRRPATTTSRSISAAGWGDAVLRLPAIHLVFGLAKRWLLGTHHGAVGGKHLQAYLDEYVFRFNRRTAKSIGHRFARLVEQAVLTPPASYRAIIGQTRPA